MIHDSFQNSMIFCANIPFTILFKHWKNLWNQITVAMGIFTSQFPSNHRLFFNRLHKILIFRRGQNLSWWNKILVWSFCQENWLFVLLKKLRYRKKKIMEFYFWGEQIWMFCKICWLSIFTILSEIQQDIKKISKKR